MKNLKDILLEYYEQLDKEDKAFREKYKGKCKNSNCFMYDREKLKQATAKECKRINNISKQKLCIKRLIKLMEE